jgi:probable blue pigment (indigoidine) exporter
MSQNKSDQNKWIVAGVLFALLWSSASTATKIGLTSAQPLVIAEIRFMIAGILMLLYAHVIKRHRLPSGTQWRHLIIYGLLNITIYLGCYIVAMQHVTAGVGSLAVATNPLFISFLSVIFLKKKLSSAIIIAIVLGTSGVVVAALPLLQQASITTPGLLLLLFSMLSYSAGAIYFSLIKWNVIDLVTINGWQTFIGGIALLPFVMFTFNNTANHFTTTLWASIFWLAIPVSIFTVQIWLWLLKTNTVKAGLWLFLCPVFGFALAAWLTHDVISSYTIIGVVLVLAGLFISQRARDKIIPNE